MALCSSEMKRCRTFIGFWINVIFSIFKVAKILDLNSKKGDKIYTHTIRFWEKEFKQLKPRILNGNRRYYDEKNIELLEKVYFLLKEQGMTINGVKNLLNSAWLDESSAK